MFQLKGHGTSKSHLSLHVWKFAVSEEYQPMHISKRGNHCFNVDRSESVPFTGTASMPNLINLI